MYKVDYHIHSAFSADCKEEIVDVIEEGIKLNLDEIAITEHLEVETGLAETYKLDLESYYIRINELKDIYKDKIKIVFGVEIGYSNTAIDYIEEIIDKYNFDFIISSIHSVGKYHFLNNDFFEGREQTDCYMEYFEKILEAVKNFKNYDVLGHLDFICRYGNYEVKEAKYEDYKDIIDRILIQVIDDKKGIEVNTSGMRYGRGDFYPSKDILKRYRELGGLRITIGSDSHKKEDISREFENVLKVLKEIGFESYSIFENRKEKFIKF